MTMADWRFLVVQSITDPAEAGRRLIAMAIPRDALWIGLSLVVVLNTMIFALSNVLIPGPSPLPDMLTYPPVYLAVSGGGLLLSIYSMYWIGRMMGGTGSLDDMMVLLIWMQGLRFLVQTVTLVLVLTFPLLSVILVIASFLVGLFILMHFIDQAHRFASLGRAAAVLIASSLAILLGLSVLVALIGGPMIGTPPDV